MRNITYSEHLRQGPPRRERRGEQASSLENAVNTSWSLKILSRALSLYTTAGGSGKPACMGLRHLSCVQWNVFEFVSAILTATVIVSEPSVTQNGNGCVEKCRRWSTRKGHDGAALPEVEAGSASITLPE